MSTTPPKIICDQCGKDITHLLSRLLVTEPAQPEFHTRSGQFRPDRDFCGTECMATWSMRSLGWTSIAPPEPK